MTKEEKKVIKALATIGALLEGQLEMLEDGHLTVSHPKPFKQDLKDMLAAVAVLEKHFDVYEAKGGK